jgi:hypothetical protein
MNSLNVKNVKNIWLNTIDCTIANGGTNATRRFFTFFDLPLIQIKKNSYLRVNSVTLSGVGAPQAIDKNWNIKLHNVAFNNQQYYNSDKTAEPTIINFNYDTKNSVQNGLFSLEVLPQDINSITIEIFDNTGAGCITSTGNFDVYLNLIIEEYD